MRFSSGLFRDRVDVLDRRMKLTGQQNVGIAEEPLARNVPCLFVQSGASEIASLLGALQSSSLHVLFNGASPRIEKGQTLRIPGTQTEYNVEAVERHPSDHRVEVQACRVRLDPARVPVS